MKNQNYDSGPLFPQGNGQQTPSRWTLDHLYSTACSPGMLCVHIGTVCVVLQAFLFAGTFVEQAKNDPGSGEMRLAHRVLVACIFLTLFTDITLQVEIYLSTSIYTMKMGKCYKS